MIRMPESREICKQNIKVCVWRRYDYQFWFDESKNIIRKVDQSIWIQMFDPEALIYLLYFLYNNNICTLVFYYLKTKATQTFLC